MIKGFTVAALAAVAGLAGPGVAGAQTDYFNTDHGRPVVIEDAYPTERFAFELQVAPVRLERSQGGSYRWGIEPELAYGVLPRTQIEVGLPLAFVDRSGASDGGLAGIRLSVLRNLNIETEGLPALGLAADVLLPVGEFAPDRAYPSLKAIATRSFSFARLHLNGQATFGSAPDPSDDLEAPAHELSRWQTGVAIDKTFPLKSSLVIADLVARHEGMAMELETPVPAAERPPDAERREAMDLLVERLLSDPSIRERVASDPELRRLAGEATGVEFEETPTPPPSHGGHRSP